MKKCMEYEVGVPGQEVDQRTLGERLWKKTARQARKLNKEDAIDRNRADDHDRCFFSYWLTQLVLDKIQRAVKWFCVCLCACAHASACSFACKGALTSACMREYVCVHVRVRVHVCVHACVHACVRA